jgi:hypothetical protein
MKFFVCNKRQILIQNLLMIIILHLIYRIVALFEKRPYFLKQIDGITTGI